MKRKHLYIEAGTVIDASTRYYNVWIGQSAQAERDYHYIKSYANLNNYYFAVYDLAVTDFLSNIHSNYGNVDIIDIDARDLVRHIKSATRPALSATSLHNQHALMTQLSSAYRVSNSIAKERSK